MILIMLDLVDGDKGEGGSKQLAPKRERSIRDMVSVAARDRHGARPIVADDPLLESWQKLLAKYRRK